MDSDDLQTFNQAMALARSGNRTGAYTLFEGLSRRYPRNIKVWLWLAFTAGNLVEARQAIEKAARLEPYNPAVTEAQVWLAEQEKPPINLQPVAPFTNVATPSEPQTPPKITTFAASGAAPVTFQRRKKKKAFIFIPAAALALIAIIGIALVAPGLLTSEGIGDVPNPPASRKVELSVQDQQQILQETAAAGNFKYGFYASSDTPDKLRAFYSGRMQEQGWQLKLDSGVLGATQSFIKDNKGVLILLRGPLSEKDLNNAARAYRNKLKVGDTLVIVFEGSSQDVPTS